MKNGYVICGDGGDDRAAVTTIIVYSLLNVFITTMAIYVYITNAQMIRILCVKYKGFYLQSDKRTD